MAQQKMILLVQIKKQNFNWQLQCEFPASLFRFILLMLCKTFLSRAELLQFLLQIAPDQCEHKAYP